MKIYNVILLLVFLAISCQQNTVDESNEKSFHGKFKKNKDWWPNQLDLGVLREQSSLTNPMGEEFDYEKAFNSLI